MKELRTIATYYVRYETSFMEDKIMLNYVSFLWAQGELLINNMSLGTRGSYVRL